MARISKKIKVVKGLRKTSPHRWMSPFFDKMDGRALAVRLGIDVPRLLAVVEKPDETPSFSDLPDSFVVKPSNGNANQGVFRIVDGIDLMDVRPFSRSILDSALKKLELPQGKCRICIEELLNDRDGSTGLPKDYKFYNFGESNAFVHIIKRKPRKNTSANLHWSIHEDRSPVRDRLVKNQVPCDDPPPIPAYLDTMIATAKKLSTSMDAFARVDLYATPAGTVFGESTEFPHGGKDFTEKGDIWLGSRWRELFGASRTDFLKYLKYRLHVT